MDPLLTVWVLGSLLAIGQNRMGLAGLLVGLAAATKQQGLLFLPLVCAVGLAPGTRPEHSTAAAGGPAGEEPRAPNRQWLPWLSFFLGFALVAGAIFGWDLARQQRPGFFWQSVISYGGLRLAPLSEWADRARSWLGLVRDFWSSPWTNALLLGALLVAGAKAGQAVLRRRQAQDLHRSRLAQSPSRRPGFVARAILLFGFLFLLAHCLLEVQPWDRYLLGLVPLAALVSARALF